MHAINDYVLQLALFVPGRWWCYATHDVNSLLALYTDALIQESAMYASSSALRLLLKLLQMLCMAS
jgi:hypothetical protein